MDRWNELERVGKLRDSGLLSNEEFEALKSNLLSDDENEKPSEGEPDGAVPSAFHRYRLLIAALLVAAIVGLVFFSGRPVATNSSTSAWQQAGTGDLVSCVGHWSYAPALAKALDVGVTKRDAVSYNLLIQKIEVGNNGNALIRSENIAMTENTRSSDGVVVDAILHDNEGRGVTLQCRSGGGRLTYQGQNIAMRQSDKDLKAVIEAKGWNWPVANGANAIDSTVSPNVNKLAANAFLGNCHMGSCSWGIVQSATERRADNSGRLVMVRLLGGTSRTENSRKVWDTKPHDVYVFCSRILPAVIIRDGSAWQVDVLDLANGVPEILLSSAMTYGQVCHRGDKTFPNDAASLGYQPIPDDRQEVSIDKPEDILAVAGGRP